MHKTLRLMAIPLGLTLLVILGSYLRLWGVDAWRLSTDDAFLYQLASTLPLNAPFDYAQLTYQWIATALLPKEHWSDIVTITPISGHPGLYYLLLHALSQVSSDPTVWRMLAFIPAVLSIPLVFLLGKYSSGILSGLLAAFVLTFADIHIVFSQEIRSYALFVFLLFAMFVSIVRYDSTKQTSWMLLYAFTAFLALFTHYGAVIPILCIGLVGIYRISKANRQNITALLCHQGFWGWGVIHAALAAFYLWQHSIFLSTAGQLTPGDWESVPLLVRGALSALIVLLVPAKLIFFDSMPFFVLPTAVFIFGLYALYRDKKYEWLFIALGSCVLTMLLVALALHPHYATRHFSHLMPVIFVVSFYPFSQWLRTDGWKNTSIFAALFVVFCGVNLLSDNGQALSPDYYRQAVVGKGDRKYLTRSEDWENINTQLRGAMQPTDVVLLGPLDWMLAEVETRTAYHSDSFWDGRKHYVCSKVIKVFHMNPKEFNDCIISARRAFPQAKRVWYFSAYDHLHMDTHTGKTLRSADESQAIQAGALAALTTPTVTAYALPSDFVLSVEDADKGAEE